jgi:hypothetical protein
LVSFVGTGGALNPLWYPSLGGFYFVFKKYLIFWCDVSGRGNLDAPDEGSTLVYELDVKCTRNKQAPQEATDPNILYSNIKVLLPRGGVSGHQPRVVCRR